MPSAELVRLCADSEDPRAWEEFIRRYNPLITIVVLRTCRQWGEYSHQAADDLVQEIYLKLCAEDRRLLRDFRPDHPESFMGYIKVLAANLVHDHFKSARSAKRGAGKAGESLDSARATAKSGSVPHPERGILLHEIESCLARVAPGQESARDRLIFWLYYRHGLTAQAISALPALSLTTKGVESVILRLVRLLQIELATKRSGPNAPKGLHEAESL